MPHSSRQDTTGRLEIANSFRQDTTGRLQVTFLTLIGSIVAQPEGLPTIEIVYIDPDNLGMTTALPLTIMFEIEPGRYFFDWRVPLDEPLLAHQVIYRGKIDTLDVLGEDILTVLPATPQCLFTPTILTKVKGGCGCPN